MAKVNFLIEEATELMLSVGYPTLIDTMKNLGIDEIKLELRGCVDYYITSQGALFYRNSARQHVEKTSNLLESKEDPQRDLIGQGISGYEFPTDVYCEWCKVVADKIEHLKKNFTKIDKIIERLNKIPISYTREVLFEKNKS